MSGDMMPKDFIEGIQHYMLDASNMTESQAWDFGFRIWQFRKWLCEYMTIEADEDALTKAYCQGYDCGSRRTYDELKMEIAEAIREGEWVESPYEDADGMPAYRCSECGCLCEGGYNYCFMCGAKMKGVDE